MKKIEILWTGGWDSTFRIVELSRQECTVTPYYIVDKDRASIDYELKSMNNILALLKEKKATKAKFNDIVLVKKEDIPNNQEVSDAYKKIASKTNLGSQHDWLARFALFHKNMELGTEAGDPKTSHILQSIDEFGSLVFKDGIGYLDKKKSSREGLFVLGNFSFPIIQKTELDMVKLIKKLGYEDVMKYIWFCHTPINGECCGLCHPCELKIESNMEFLMTNRALRNYKIRKIFKKLFGERITKKIVKIYKKRRSEK